MNTTKVIKIAELIKTNEERKSSFFDYHKSIEKELPLLRVPCKDCACETGFYTEIADMLLEEDIETQDKVLSSWYCHNNFGGACRGAYNYVHSRRDEL